MKTWPPRWRAHWIWFERADLESAYTRGEPPERPLDGVAYLRRSFTLDRARAGRCRVTADSRYVLLCDGVELGRGPVRSQPWAWTFDEYALELDAGEHVLAAIVRHYGGATNASIPAQPVGALGFGSFLLEADLGDMLIASDDGWRACEAPYERRRRHEGPPPNEHVDGRAISHGWPAPGFDDADWPRACVVDPSGPGIRDARAPTEPYPVLQPRPIPPLAERVVDLASSDGVLFDAGEILCAHPILRIDAEPGTVIELRAGEALDDQGHPVLDVRDWRLRYTAAGVPGEAIESLEPVGLRYVGADVLEGRARGLTLYARERIFPRPPGASFSCSDPDLEAIWRAGVRTLDVCSTDAFIDCPGREQRAWLGDAYGHTILTLLVNPDTSLVRWMLRLHANGARPDGLLPMVAAGDFGLRATTIPDFTLLWVLALAHVHRWTGDDELLGELLPTATRGLNWFEQRRAADGLLHDLPGWVFIDWAQLERGSTFAPVDGLYALALDTIANITGDEQLRARADATRAAFDAFWDPDRGVYTDTAGGARTSQHTNALAILCGAAPRDRWDALLDHILDPARVRRTRTPGDPGPFEQRLNSQYLPPQGFDDTEHVVEAQPFFSHFVHQAVARAGRYEQLLALIRRWAPSAKQGTFGEYWDNRPGLASLCHAWAAVPLYDLIVHVLGIAPAAPGFATVKAEPHLGDLTSASATIASPQGWIGASASPEGATLHLPLGIAETLR